MSDEKDRFKGFDPPFEDNPLGEVLEDMHSDEAVESAVLYSPLEEILSVDMDFSVSALETQSELGTDAIARTATESELRQPVSAEPLELGDEVAYPPGEVDMPFEYLYEEQMDRAEVPPEYAFGKSEGAFEASLKEIVEIEPEDTVYEEFQETVEPVRLEEVISSIDDQLEEVAEESESVKVETVKAPRVKAHQKYVIFSLADARYAVPLKNVIEIGHRPKTTLLPHVPDWLLGVTNRRGDILSVVDLRAFLGIGEMNTNQPGRMLVVRTTNEEMTTGLIVDQVNKILDLPVDQVQTPTAPVETKLAPFMIGVCEYRDELLAVLDLEPILLSDEMRQFEPV